jgi:ABC-type dipeptide/oligopeptide/nickel transport system ATPase component
MTEPSATAEDHVQPVLEVRDLVVELAGKPPTPLVKGISLEVHRGEVMGIVGETGAGKSLTGWAITRMLRPPLILRADRLMVSGMDVMGLSEADLRELRRRRVAYVVQNPRSSLEPVRRIGKQLHDLLRMKRGLTRAEARDESFKLLTRAGIADPEPVAYAYPHELSGGLAQRVVIAMALSGSPELIVADEPTSSLDLTIQAQILDLFTDLVTNEQVGLVLITHDIGIIAEYCNRVAVMYDGNVVESGPVDSILNSDQPYTSKLISSAPRMPGSEGGNHRQ